MSPMDELSHLVIGSLERLFRWWGRLVVRRPYPVILTCIAVTALASVGFLKFRMEHRANLLWIPLSSPYNENQAWLDKNFKNNDRAEIVIYKSENVLTPSSLQEMLALHKKILAINIDGKAFEDICTSLPIADIFGNKRRRKRQAEDEDDDDYDYDIWADEYDDSEYETDNAVEVVHFYKPRINFGKYGTKAKQNKTKSSGPDLPRDIYCDLVTTLNSKCLVASLLEMWRYDEQLIMSASQQEIIDAVNLLSRSPWFGYDRNFTKLLGGVTRNSTGHIVAAETSQMLWSIKVPDDVEVVDSQGSGLELELADATSLAWEEAFIHLVLNSSKPGAVTLANAGKSFGDVSAGAIFFDAWLMAGGYVLMFAYTILMLGRLNSLEVRLYLSIAGILGVGMGLVIALGVSSVMGYPYTPMHSMLPFLCLGIGIDDMFVIVQCWNNLRVSPSTPVGEKMGLALQHAGVSITVTSLTDIFAFGVGAISRMPGLESFCVGTAIGLAAIFLLQISWFVAWMSLDEARVAAGRDGVLPCIVHREGGKGLGCTGEGRAIWTPLYTRLLSSPVMKALVILATLGMFGVGAWGWSMMRMKFDPFLLLPGDTYLRKWVDTNTEFYPKNGWTADVYSDTFNHSSLESIDQLVTGFEGLQEQGSIREVEDWWSQMKEYAVEETNFSSWRDLATEEHFSSVLSDFLFSSQGAQFKKNFIFETPLICNQPAPKIAASKFSIEYFFMDEPEQHIPARGEVTQLLETTGAPYTFSHSKIYAAWETDEIIGFELWRNIALAMAAVFVVTMLLLANLQICLYVMCIVTITLTDIVGFLHFWDITIDIISCVNIVLAIGLCVDYSVHIGLAYMVAKGTRQDKAVEAIAAMGPAVFNGGITTFLALVLCSLSYSHVFLTFFKVFMLTVVFGLFHGLVFFPVLLSIVGPVSQTEAPKATSTLTISTVGSLPPPSSAPSSPPALQPGPREGKTGGLEGALREARDRRDVDTLNI